MSRWILRGVLLSVLCFGAANALHAQGCEGMPYLHQNRFDPKPLELEGVRGIAVDQNGNVMAQLCVGLFSEPDHQLLRYAQSDNKGAFTVETKGLPDGQYRFVGQLVGFCPANAVVNINSRS